MRLARFFVQLRHDIHEKVSFSPSCAKISFKHELRHREKLR